MKKLIQFVGALALFGWTALGVYTWWQVDDKVQVTIKEGSAEDTTEFALLSDRLDVLSDDLDTLVASLGENFGLLAEAVQAERAGDTDERVLDLLRSIDAGLRGPALLQELARAAAADERKPIDEPLDERPAAVEVAEASPAIEEPEVESRVVDEQPAKRSFLAFRLPSRDFQFEGRQTFEILGDLSRVGFDAKSTLHDFSGISDRVRGSFTVDLAHPSRGIQGRVEIKTASLSTDLKGRDEAMYEHLDAEERESISFVPTVLRALQIDAEEKRLSGELSGRMTIRGVTRDMTLKVTAHVDPSRRLVIEGQSPLLLGDYGIPVPNQLGVIGVDEELRIWIHLRARAKSGGVQ